MRPAANQAIGPVASSNRSSKMRPEATNEGSGKPRARDEVGRQRGRGAATADNANREESPPKLYPGERGPGHPVLGHISARSAVVRTVFDPDGFVEVDGVMMRAIWHTADQSRGGMPGDNVYIWTDIADGQLVAAFERPDEKGPYRL